MHTVQLVRDKSKTVAYRDRHLVSINPAAKLTKPEASVLISIRRRIQWYTMISLNTRRNGNCYVISINRSFEKVQKLSRCYLGPNMYLLRYGSYTIIHMFLEKMRRLESQADGSFHSSGQCVNSRTEHVTRLCVIKFMINES